MPLWAPSTGPENIRRQALFPRRRRSPSRPSARLTNPFPRPATVSLAESHPGAANVEPNLPAGGQFLASGGRRKLRKRVQSDVWWNRPGHDLRGPHPTYGHRRQPRSAQIGTVKITVSNPDPGKARLRRLHERAGRRRRQGFRGGDPGDGADHRRLHFPVPHGSEQRGRQHRGEVGN